MAIDKSGKWWVSGAADDLQEYLKAFSEDSYPIHQFRLARCECGSVEFQLAFSDSDGVARRTCVACGKEHFMCDSGEFWDEAETERWQCVECVSTTANVGVGFSLYDDQKDIHWLYIAERCARCGVLGCCASWKIGYNPSLQLMDQV